MNASDLARLVNQRLGVAQILDSIEWPWRGSPPSVETPLGKRRLPGPVRNYKRGQR